ncbi:vanadium-dependent haloperoxidase [uncultured Paludibaculum sp.]|uniref:vanadium-dependent haloperoxidase n=1 Tax=uncultured Paludibaculum sp. TaxID=1765020 RepID=UPI002AAC4ADF|nr:vanadium-dependent haloperoxidase [uncultured Paludibaculum sp.]
MSKDPCSEKTAPIIGLGNFHKTLKHDPKTGLVNPDHYREFEAIANHGGDFECVPRPDGAAKFINPQAGWAKEHLGPDPGSMDMPPPPCPMSDATAAEMTELYWMALLRDKRFADFSANDPDIQAAIMDLSTAFDRGSADLKLGYDLPAKDGKLDLTAQTLFRGGLPGEDQGPLVSQFFLHDIAYGTQIILQKQFPYAECRNYLTDWDSWLKAQDTGKDSDGNDYPADNDYFKHHDYFDKGAFCPDGLRRIRNMRDLARFVNKDALHQAYFNAALLLSNWGAPFAAGNPYLVGYEKQRSFGTFGGPHLLAQVSEVAARALRVVWRQKWGVYRRFRPEVYGGLMEAQSQKRLQCELPKWVFETKAAQRIQDQGPYLLPMAFTAGSPAHPAYGAGHATVAGACVTILKAWFDGSKLLKRDVLPNATHPVTAKPVHLVMPDKDGSDVLPEYGEGDLTVEGELNKLAANVAFGRCMGGVHWRTDNTRSLRLGEKIATIILRRECHEYAERDPVWSYNNFDGHKVTIGGDGKVTVDGNEELACFYNRCEFRPF